MASEKQLNPPNSTMKSKEMVSIIHKHELSFSGTSSPNDVGFRRGGSQRVRR